MPSEDTTTSSSGLYVNKLLSELDAPLSGPLPSMATMAPAITKRIEEVTN